MRKALDFVTRILLLFVTITIVMGLYEWITMPLSDFDLVASLIIAILIIVVFNYDKKRKEEPEE